MARRFALLAAGLAANACSSPAPPLPPAGPPPTASGPTAPAALEPTSSAAAIPAPPATPKRPVVDVYHGVKVTDDYRWLEDWGSAEVKSWTVAQTHRARAALDALPAAAALRERMTELKTAQSADYFDLWQRGGVLFALKSDPKLQQPQLITLKSPDDPGSARVLVDPNRIDAKGKTTIDFYTPSLDGKLVAVSLSEGGSEDGTVHVYEVATGKELADVIPRVNGGTAGGSVEWNAKGTGFWYTRYPRGSERAPEDMGFYQEVYLHELGKKTEDDRYAIGKEFPRIAEVELYATVDGKHLLAEVANGDGGEFAHWLLGPSGKWKELTKHADKIVRARFARGEDALYLLSRNGAPKGKILRLSLDKPDLAKAEVVVPESEASIRSFTALGGRLYVVDLLGGPSRVRVFAKGKPAEIVPLPPVASVGQVAPFDARGSGGGADEVLIRSETFIDPPGWFRFGGAEPALRKTALRATSPADFSDSEVVRETCKSKDGTAVPLNIIRRKGARLDGKSPALLTGYGGYDISIQPRFNEEVRVWLEAGGVYAVANLRGGGEFGEAWHEAGKLTKKQNVFDDFTACAQHLIEARYTSKDRLAIMGGSNGGLLMGAVLTQHPDLVKAVVSRVGIYDMLRVELSPNGAFNVTEFGTVKDKAQFDALYAYSPYHHVIDGTAYPAVLLTTGVNDPRVDPMQSRKMAARLQAATSSKAPVLLLTKMDAGHGIGGSLKDEIDQAVDTYAFLFAQLGVAYPPPR